MVQIRRQQVAAWLRWAAKKSENRVKRERLRDAAGRVVGYGPPVPVPEPPLPAVGCRKLELPSGRVLVELAGPFGVDLRRLQEAYWLARRPQKSEADVGVLSVTEDEVKAWMAKMS
jgi:hypothetical protein